MTTQSTATQRESLIAELLEEHPLQDALAFDNAARDLAAEPGRYLLIEESRYDGLHFFTVHNTPGDAADYHDGQEYPDDWSIVVLVDLETGDEIEGETSSTTHFTTTWEIEGDESARKISDKDALDALALLLSAEQWPGASGMEDVAEIVWATGRQPVPNAPHWERH